MPVSHIKRHLALLLQRDPEPVTYYWRVRLWYHTTHSSVRFALQECEASPAQANKAAILPPTAILSFASF